MREAGDLDWRLRRLCVNRRREAHETAPGAAQAVRDRFIAARLHDGARIVSAYRRIRSELDPEPLMLALIERGCRLCLPVIGGSGLPLRFREWTPGTRMVPGPFGAEVPADGAWLEPDLLIVPLLAFARSGHRVGYGAGYYDMTIAALRAKKTVLAVGIAFAAQEIAVVPTTPRDARLDLVLTEREVIDCRAM